MPDDVTYAVSLSVYTEDQQHVLRACEVLSRACAGLALEGIMANLMVAQGTTEEAGVDE